MTHERSARRRAPAIARASARGLALVPAREAQRTHAAAAESLAWQALAPRGIYARFGAPLLNAILIALAVPIALVPALVVALANWVAFRDARKILFVQARVGHRGAIFSIYKFRTMREVGSSELDSWSSGEDRLRVTPLGRLLRQTHLDELPQLLNIVRGEMRFIGPRPEMVEIERWADEQVAGFSERLAIKPGITGYAQITQGYTGHDVEAYKTKLALNLRYLREISLVTDLAIIFGTVLWMLRGKGWLRQAEPEPAVAEPEREARAA